jgi:hypothetical protein
MRLSWARASKPEREARAICQRICVQAFYVIRTSAHLRRPYGAPDDFDGDYAEWIRLVADACDGLARPRPTANNALAYRRSVWSPVQTTWVESVLTSE